MQTKKLSFSIVQGKLSRKEMKSIMAGSDDGEACNCNSNDDCKNNEEKKTCYNGDAYGCTKGTYVGWCEK